MRHAIKALLMALAMVSGMVVAGCAPVVAWRGTVHYHINRAELGATITNAPRNGDTHIEASKETDAKVGEGAIPQ